MSNYEKKLYGKIAEVVSDVCNNPAIHFSETDIHVLMMKALMEIGCLKKMKDTNCTIGMNRDGGVSSTKYKTMLVHREYGHNDYKKATSDIVIFDEDDIETIDKDPRVLKSEGKYLKPKYIFEFGTEKVSGSKTRLKDEHLEEQWAKNRAKNIRGGKGKKYTVHIANDLQKLSKCKTEGFLIHIHRNYVQKHKNRKTIEKYQNEFKNVWEAWEKKAVVKMLVFFVEIGVPAWYTKNKVKMFNPYPKEARDYLIDVNQRDIECTIKNFLKGENKDELDIKEIYANCNAKRLRKK